MPEQQYQEDARDGYENREASTHTDPFYGNDGLAMNARNLELQTLSS
jgi:hypothetical protein